MTADLKTNPNASVIAPPFDLATATRKMRLAEDAWNSRDPRRELSCDLTEMSSSPVANRSTLFSSASRVANATIAS